jgi:hypothetical protein
MAAAPPPGDWPVEPEEPREQHYELPPACFSSLFLKALVMLVGSNSENRSMSKNTANI